MAELSELGQAALEYATNKGWYVFPIVPWRKKPAMIADYYNLSSREPEQIRAWWAATPDANIGLDCGKSGLIAIDADSESGHGASHAGLGAPLAGLMLLSGGKRAWDTLVSQTPSGGEHYIFNAPANETEGIVRSTRDTFGIAGIDSRSKGGYIVLPPSQVNADGIKGRYEFRNPGATILPVPRKLLSPPGTVRDEDGLTPLEQTLHSGDKIARGGRDDYLIKIAGKMRGLGFNQAEILALVRASYYERCEDGDDPFTEADFKRIAESAASYKPGAEIPTLHKEIAKEPDGIWNDIDESHALSATNFILHHIEPTNWVVDGIFQSSSLNMLMGPPKAGKSTILRHLALCSAYGLPFLGRWSTQKGRVLYYSLQENKPHLRKWLLSALWGAGVAQPGEIPPDIGIDFVFRLGHHGERAIKGTLDRIEKHRYGLVIVDMYGRYAGVTDLDDYAENDAATDALNAVAQATGACVVWAHHDRKSGGGFMGAIGSQAIRGAVYTTMRNWKEGGHYYIETEQRDGDDIAPTAIALDPKTQGLRAVGSHLSMALSDAIHREERIRKLIEYNPNLSVDQVRDAVGGRIREIGPIMDKVRAEMKALEENAG